MSPKKRIKAESSSPGPSNKEVDTGELLGSGATKSALCKIINSLHRTGHINVTLPRKTLQKQIEASAKVNTPHGKVVQIMMVGGYMMEYIHPTALLYYLCSISEFFRSTMAHAIAMASGGVCQIVIYSDAATPGNVFRPDKGRKFEAFYWCMPEWPDHVLQRSMCWNTLALLRCSIVDNIAGGLSFVVSKLIRLFATMEAGILLPGEGGPMMFRAKFNGILADLIGHAQLTAWKGPNAVRSCMRCANLCARADGRRTAGDVGLAEHDDNVFVQNTNAEIYFVVDNLAAFAEAHRDDRYFETKLKTLQTELGFNHDPLGIVLDREMRSIYRSVEHQLVDRMHVYCQDGVANSEVACLLHRMAALDPPITNDMVRTFISGCSLPKEHGKTNVDWLEPKRLRNNSLTAFASMTLSIVGCLSMFLALYGVAALLPLEVECFGLLDSILGLLSLGPSGSMAYINTLQHLTSEHHRLFAMLYPYAIKPKLHQTHHVVSGMRDLGRLLACFVTERKHRIAKHFAINTCRHFEHTTLLDCLHQQCHMLSHGHDIFSKEFLVHPNAVKGHDKLFTSSVAVCHAGSLHAGDVVCIRDGVVGRIDGFWRYGCGGVLVRLQIYECHNNECSLRDTSRCKPLIVEAEHIIGACIWCPCSIDRVIKVRLPPALLF